MTYFWIGPGVFSSGGKDYHPGEEIKGLDKKQAESMLKKGTVSEEAPRVGRPSGELATLRDQVKELTADRDKLQGVAATLREALAVSEATNKALTEQLAAQKK